MTDEGGCTMDLSALFGLWVIVILSDGAVFRYLLLLLFLTWLGRYSLRKCHNQKVHRWVPYFPTEKSPLLLRLRCSYCKQACSQPKRARYPIALTHQTDISRDGHFRITYSSHSLQDPNGFCSLCVFVFLSFFLSFFLLSFVQRGWGTKSLSGARP